MNSESTQTILRKRHEADMLIRLAMRQNDITPNVHYLLLLDF